MEYARRIAGYCDRVAVVFNLVGLYDIRFIVLHSYLCLCII